MLTFAAKAVTDESIPTAIVVSRSRFHLLLICIPPDLYYVKRIFRHNSSL
jgi:hypothetical protein